MAVTVNTLRAKLRVGTTDQRVQPAFDEAAARIAEIVDGEDVPEKVLDRATLKLGEAIYRDGLQPSGGNTQQAGSDGGPTPVRQPKDPESVIVNDLKPYITKNFDRLYKDGFA